LPAVRHACTNLRLLRALTPLWSDKPMVSPPVRGAFSLAEPPLSGEKKITCYCFVTPEAVRWKKVVGSTSFPAVGKQTGRSPWLIVGPGNRKEVAMQWNIKKSARLKKTITENPKLMTEMSRQIEKVFREFKISLPGMSYVFEPRVFSFTDKESPEIAAKSRAAMLEAILAGLIVEEIGSSASDAIDVSRFRACLPQCGPLDPVSLEYLERLRIVENVADDPVPIRTSGELMRRIVGDRKLMYALTEALFPVLEEARIRFGKKEGCVFTPVVFQSPIYAQKVGAARRTTDMPGFGPQLYASADPTPEPAAMRMKPLPGIIEVGGRKTRLVPGVIIDRWWWVGIPAPELLRALEVVRKYR